jgi:hypothetical protein
MRPKQKRRALALWLACLLAAGARLCSGAAKTQHFAIEVSGIVCGYLEVRETPLRRDGADAIAQESEIFLMLSVLGSRFNSTIREKALIDAASRRQLRSDLRIDQNGVQHDFSFRATATEAVMRSSLRGGEEKTVPLAPGVLVGNDQLFRRLRSEFAAGRAAEVRCDILEIMEEEVQPSRFRRIGAETLHLAGSEHACLVVEQVNARTGLKTTYWIDPGCDFFVQYEVSGRKVYLSDRGVVDRLKVANIDHAFITRTNAAVIDPSAITYMKLKLSAEPTGALLSPADLNVPGQKFSGTVRGNLIEGTMEIAHPRYDGRGAPPFPPSFQADARLRPYLTPSRFIESGDPLLAAKARELTAGARDSWQAATRLSRWVAENVGYAIPGGGTARKTYDLRAGECGSHSMLLAAFCRAVGIPARVVFGALYVPNFGGGFGQHAWNEIYMGAAGWIPVDATAHEADFVDSGHIRLMEVATAASNRFNGREIEVLEHRLATVPPGPGHAGGLDPYLGRFSQPRKGRTFAVREMDGSMVLDVPGRLPLPFQERDGRGRWVCKLIPQVYLTFRMDDKGRAREMAVHEIARLPRSGPAAEVPGVPAELAPYTGTFHAAAVNADMTVRVQDGRLAVFDPTDNTTARFRPAGTAGEWIDDLGFVTISFEKDAAGQVTVMKIDSADTFLRGELAASIVEKAVAEGGAQAGLEKYSELKAERSEGVIFSEESLNLVAYHILNAGKLDDAIAMFQLIVREYPRSSNAHGCLAEAYFKCGRQDLALACYKESLRLNPANERARQRIAELQER